MIEETKIKTQELVHGILAIIERAHTQLGIAGAIKRKIIILSPKAIKILAKN
ncbi:MAG: hypothetical protein Q6363_010220 [Candidatus Njordarchaeota archaeon]